MNGPGLFHQDYAACSRELGGTVRDTKMLVLMVLAVGLMSALFLSACGTTRETTTTNTRPPGGGHHWPGHHYPPPPLAATTAGRR
jgi:hypothetical protein